MKPDELLAAASTLQNATDYWPYREWQLSGTKTAAIGLARHIQRIYDPTPVDEAWVATVADQRKDVKGLYCLCQQPAGDVFLLLDHRRCDAYRGIHFIGTLKTRGDVRRLCEVMGIELREEA